jgi:conjugal transfer pilus assembly protein TraW
LLAASGAALLGWPLVSALRAADYGQMGQTFPIIETDLLTTIETRLRTLEANGGIERMQRQMQEQAVASVRGPSRSMA